MIEIVIKPHRITGRKSLCCRFVILKDGETLIDSNRIYQKSSQAIEAAKKKIKQWKY